MPEGERKGIHEPDEAFSGQKANSLKLAKLSVYPNSPLYELSKSGQRDLLVKGKVL